MSNKVVIIFLVTSLMACQRQGIDPAPLDNLEAIGISGTWEISNEVVNGVISDMLPKCCEFLAFIPDDNINDYKGLFTSTNSQGLINSGTFEADIVQQTILFIDDDNDEFTFEYSIDGSQENLTIDFTEDGTDYTQGWVRIE